MTRKLTDVVCDHQVHYHTVDPEHFDIVRMPSLAKGCKIRRQQSRPTTAIAPSSHTCLQFESPGQLRRYYPYFRIHRRSEGDVQG